MAPLASIFSISAVQLTFSFETAAMQLTPTFKMGVFTSPAHTQDRHDAFAFVPAPAVGDELSSKFRDCKDSACGWRARQHPNDSVSAEANYSRFAFVCGGGIATRS